MKRLISVGSILLTVFLASCGGGGGGSNDYGEDINYGFELQDISCTGTITGGKFEAGSFSVSIADGTMNSCVNAEPSAEAVSTLPSGLDIESYESNITDGTGYSFTLGPDSRMFNTTNAGAITLTVPYDPAKLPVGATVNSTNIFIRVIDHLTNMVVDLSGTLDTVNHTITAPIMGLPSDMTVVAIYNPGMVSQPSSDTATASVSGSPEKAMPSTWGAKRYCIIYDANLKQNKDALAKYQSTYPTRNMADMMENEVAKWAVRAQNEYTSVGFRQPALVIFSGSSDPCGASLGTTARFNVHVRAGGSEFSIAGSDGVVDVRGNHYGRIYIDPENLNLTINDWLGTSYATVAHEMLHAIHYGYDFDTWATSLLGYDEGTATTFGRTLAVTADLVSRRPYARPKASSTLPSFLLTSYIGQSSRNGTATVDGTAYSNQDFFAYVGRKYNKNDSLSYLAGLFEQIRTDIATAAGSNPVFSFQPPRTVINGAMDIYFRSNLSGGPTMRDVYVDFIRQRAMEHNTDSQLRSEDAPYTSGMFNPTLFATGGLVEKKIDPLDIGSSSGTFPKLAPFAARAILITPTQAIAAGGTGATVNVEISAGNNTTIDGAAYLNGTYQPLSTSNTFTGFGMAATDEIVILLANVANSDNYGSASFKISGTNGSGGGGGGGSNLFLLTDFGLPGEGTWKPAYALVTPDTGGIIFASIYTDISAPAKDKNLQVQFGTASITGTGTYTITGNDPTTGPVAIAYSPGTDAAIAGTGQVFTSTGGTLTLTSWDKAIGGHITGTFSASMATDETPPDTGKLEATFDFVVGSTGPL